MMKNSGVKDVRKKIKGIGVNRESYISKVVSYLEVTH
jgi:hypothetical protein